MIQRLVCPITGGPAEVIFSRPYRAAPLQSITQHARLDEMLADKNYEIRCCPDSGLYFQTWVMETHELPRWYSTPDASHYWEEIGKQKIHWFAHQTEEILVFRQMCPEKVPVVLDFGCGWGKWASMALAFGCRVFGLEVNPQAAAFCADRGIKMVNYDQLPQMRFDFINADQVIEHLSDPLSVARHLSGCLKPGGFFKVSTPNNPLLPRQLAAAQRQGSDEVLNSRTLDSLLPLEHVNLFDNGSLKRLGQEAGLQTGRLPLIKWLGAGQMWNLPRQLNRNVIVPFKRWRARGTFLWLQKPVE